MLGTEDKLKSVRALYDDSVMAAAAVNGAGSVIYTNSAFDRVFEGNIPELADIHTGAAYEKYIFCGGAAYRVYVTPSDGISVAAFAPCASVYDSFMPVLNAAVRYAAEGISRVTDRLDDLFGGDMKLASMLNEIDRSMMTLLSEFLIPEQVAALSAAKKEDFAAVSVSESAEKYAASLQTVLIKQPMGINASISAGLYARIDIKSLLIIMTDFLVSCMEGEYYVDGIGIKLNRSGEDRMIFTLSCSRLTGQDQRLASSAVKKPSDYLPRNKLIELMEKKFGCRIRIVDNLNNSQISADIKCITQPGAYGLRSSVRFFGAPARYSDENVMLARFGVNNRYGNTAFERMNYANED